MRVKRLQNAYFPIRNMSAARTFYERVLALPLKFADGDRWVQYDAGGAGFAVGSLDEAPVSASRAILVFEVDKFDPGRVEAAGGRIIEQRDMGRHGCVLSVADSEGNIFQLFRRDET